MGKASRNKRLTAQEKIAVQREAQRRTEMRRRVLITGGSIVGVLAIVLAFVIVKVVGGSSAAANAVRGATATSVLKQVSTVPAATLTAVGAGASQTNKPRVIAGAPLTAGGKPEILYIGAEYCPYCAAERWSMAVALSRFGTFSNVGLIRSSSTDVFPNTATLTFYRSSYTSKYLAFTPVEMQTVTKAPLQNMTTAQKALLAKYDAPPYVTAQNAGSIPFVDLANKYGVIGGSSYLPQVLAGMSWSQIASALHNPASPVAKQVLGAANYLTAALCKVTSNKPANVCTTQPVTTLQGKI
jgi:thiol-disulfide isomerase/thioredoxin